jgi:hypothetical protein
MIDDRLDRGFLLDNHTEYDAGDYALDCAQAKPGPFSSTRRTLVFMG